MYSHRTTCKFSLKLLFDKEKWCGFPTKKVYTIYFYITKRHFFFSEQWGGNLDDREAVDFDRQLHDEPHQLCTTKAWASTEGSDKKTNYDTGLLVCVYI